MRVLQRAVGLRRGAELLGGACGDEGADVDLRSCVPWLCGVGGGATAARLEAATGEVGVVAGV